jgi:hypothetical protein
MSEQKEKASLPSKAITVTIGENDYEIKFPSNGALIDIEAMKISMSNGTHRDMVYTESGQISWTLIEAISTFNVLIPQLKKDLAVSSLLELDPLQSKTIIKAYNKVYYPWISQWRKVINDLDKDDEQL